MSPNDLQREPSDVIREFIARRAGGVVFTDEQDIFEMGMANSLFALELVTFVEATFALVVENVDLDRRNFASVAALSRLVERKRRPPGAVTPQVLDGTR